MRKRERKEAEATTRWWPPAAPRFAPPYLAAYECSWWAPTGRMTPFVDGISSPIYRNMTTGEETPDLPIGACRVLDNGDGSHPHWAVGADGLAIAVTLPDGRQWYVDSRASNCTMPDDKAHRCWVRHGTVGERLSVDKAGNTCKAGAGSIRTDHYHGFLEDGRLVERRGAR